MSNDNIERLPWGRVCCCVIVLAPEVNEALWSRKSLDQKRLHLKRAYERGADIVPDADCTKCEGSGYIEQSAVAAQDAYLKKIMDGVDSPNVVKVPNDISTGEEFYNWVQEP